MGDSTVTRGLPSVSGAIPMIFSRNETASRKTVKTKAVSRKTEALGRGSDKFYLRNRMMKSYRNY